MVRLELRTRGGDEAIEAQVSKERYRERGRAVGDLAYVTPRRLRFFAA